MVARFCRERWTNPTTLKRNECILRRLMRDCQVTTLAELTPTTILRWCAGADSPTPLANNTIRGRGLVVSALLEWCAQQGIRAPGPGHLTGRTSPLRQFRPTYGKAQGAYAPRWQTREEAYDRLLGAVDSHTPMGLRDEVVLRLGLCGIRAQEIVSLNVGDVRDLDTDWPSLHWMGKRYKPLHTSLGAQTATVLRRYLAAYARALGAQPPASSPLVCRSRNGRNPKNGPRQLAYGQGLARGPSGRAAVWNIVTAAAQRAGLGHVAPHDLRRSAAGILHRDKAPDGSHRFDLLDIQKVLHHADPVTTMKCYLDPMDTEVLERAARLLD
jgi:integrase